MEIIVKKYELDPDMSKAIYENIKSSKFSEEDEENEKYFKEFSNLRNNFAQEIYFSILNFFYF